MRFSLLKLHYVNIASTQHISTHLADLHLKTIIQTQRHEKKLESLAVVDRNKIKNNACKRIILSSHWMRDGQTQAKALSLIVLALQNCETKENKPKNHHYSAVIILRDFVAMVEIIVA